MNSKAIATFKTFWKYELYTALLIAGTQIVAAGTLKLDWGLVFTAVVIGCIKAAMTYWKTEE
jgi:hypothetical protein